MTLEDSADFLASRTWVVLATVEPDGSPWADVVPSAMHSGLLFFRVLAGSRSERNIRRDARVCCTQDQNPTYYEIKGVMVHGTVAPVAAADIPAELATRPDPLRPGDEPSGDCYSVSLTDVASFDFQKIERR